MPNPDVMPMSLPSGGLMWFPWQWPREPDMAIWWLGPGTHLFLCLRPFHPEGSQVRIEHPTADESYDTAAEATAAMRRFVSRCDPAEQAAYLQKEDDDE